MPLVSGDYWSIIHGNTPVEVEQDLEGIYTRVATDLVWLMKCIEVGKGILPEIENKTVGLISLDKEEEMKKTALVTAENKGIGHGIVL